MFLRHFGFMLAAFFAVGCSSSDTAPMSDAGPSPVIGDSGLMPDHNSDTYEWPDAGYQLPEPVDAVGVAGVANIDIAPPFEENHALDMLAIIDAASFPDLTETEVRAVVEEMISGILEDRFSISLNMFRVITIPELGDRDPGIFVNELLGDYEQIPESVLLLSTAPTPSRLNGGFVVEVSPDRSLCNEFRSARFGQSRYWLVVIDWNHRFGACGYDSASGSLTSDVSIGGQCQGLDGVPCTWNGTYSVCSTFVNHPLTAPHAFFVHTFVHELIHPSGAFGVRDHFNTPECIARMGGPATGDGYDYFMMCPDTFAAFASSEVGCPPVTP